MRLPYSLDSPALVVDFSEVHSLFSIHVYRKLKKRNAGTWLKLYSELSDGESECVVTDVNEIVIIFFD